MTADAAHPARAAAGAPRPAWRGAHVLVAAALLLARGLHAQRATPRAAAPADTTLCPGAESQHAITLCADSAARRADAALNVAYRRAMAHTRADRRPLLREAQRRWIAYREARCAFDASLFAGGTLEPTQRLLCWAALAEDRTRELRGDTDYEDSL